tara:strand:+ start:769 stop:978 length:210 start_codon:yes stop_codon:yes gene_type:complete
MEEFKNKLANLFYGLTPDEAIDKKICIYCKKEVKDFKDEISMREYTISAFCQDCQEDENTGPFRKTNEA